MVEAAEGSLETSRTGLHDEDRHCGESEAVSDAGEETSDREQFPAVGYSAERHGGRGDEEGGVGDEEKGPRPSGPSQRHRRDETAQDGADGLESGHSGEEEAQGCWAEGLAALSLL